MKKLLLLLFFPLLFFESDEYDVKLVSLADVGYQVIGASDLDGYLLYMYYTEENESLYTEEEVKWFYSAIGEDGSLGETTKIEFDFAKNNYPNKKQVLGFVNNLTYSQNTGELFFSCRYIKKKDFGGHRNSFTKVRNRIGVGKLRNGVVTDVKLIPICEEENNCFHPTVSEDGETIIFVADFNGGWDLYESKWSRIKNTWSKPEPIEELASEYLITFPKLINDSLLVYSFEDPENGFGKRDIYKSEKINGVWMFPENWEELNSEHDDFGLEMIDEKRGYFSSDRDYSNPKLYYFEINENKKK
ncbi:MAG: hypothetical protein AAFZ15_26975 [Bacteroidota bacterium]